jgi:site-specific DNA recombinase
MLIRSGGEHTRRIEDATVSVYASRIVLRVGVKVWDRLVRGEFEPIVSQDLFDRVALRTGVNVPGGIRRRMQDDAFPLRRYARCGVCDTVLTGSSSKGRSRRYPYYHCRHGCKGVSIPKERLEEQFAELLRNLVPDPSYWPLLREVVTELWKDAQSASFDRAALLRARVSDLADKKNRIFDLFAEGKIVESAYLDQTGRVDADLTDASRELNRLELEPLDVPALLAYAERVLTRVDLLWTRGTTAEKRKLQAAVLPNGVSYANGTLGTGETPMVLSLLAAKSAGESRMASPTGFEPVSWP